jgi:hypothetical protein
MSRLAFSIGILLLISAAHCSSLSWAGTWYVMQTLVNDPLPNPVMYNASICAPAPGQVIIINPDSNNDTQLLATLDWTGQACEELGLGNGSSAVFVLPWPEYFLMETGSLPGSHEINFTQAALFNNTAQNGGGMISYKIHGYTITTFIVNNGDVTTLPVQNGISWLGNWYSLWIPSGSGVIEGLKAYHTYTIEEYEHGNLYLTVAGDLSKASSTDSPTLTLRWSEYDQFVNGDIEDITDNDDVVIAILVQTSTTKAAFFLSTVPEWADGKLGGFLIYEESEDTDVNYSETLSLTKY